jgi:hypothetical protein
VLFFPCKVEGIEGVDVLVKLKEWSISLIPQYFSFFFNNSVLHDYMLVVDTVLFFHKVIIYNCVYFICNW